MKKTLLLSGILLLSLFCRPYVFAQGTWIKTLNKDFWQHRSLNIDSTGIGPYEMATGPNGVIAALVKMNPDHDLWLIVFNKLGNIIRATSVGHRTTLSREDCFDLQITDNNQIVYTLRHDGDGTDYEIIYGPSWQRRFEIPPMLSFPIKLILSHINTSFLQYENSLVEVDSLGNDVRSRHISAQQVIALADSDFIMVDLNSIKKENFLGDQKWSINLSGFNISYADLSFIYLRNSYQIKKINTIDGNIIWTKNINSKTFTKTSDDGFIVANQNDLSKYDSSGTLQWSKNFPFPEFGFKCISETKSKSYLTGGAWVNKYLEVNDRGYSTFITLIDSSGNGVIDSTNFFYIGNANDNYKLSFGDDAVYIAAALGKSGLQRDLLLRTPNNAQSTYCTDWSDKFTSGINYKFSDFDGNGIIDTSDIRLLSSNLWPYHTNVSPHWFRKENNSALPELRFSFENDSLNIIDTIKVYVILGSAQLAVDSIYGISFDMQFNHISYTTNLISNCNIKPTSLGDTSTNLFSFYTFHYGGVPSHVSMVLCRTNQTNAYVNGDTIASFYFIIPPDPFFLNPIYLNIDWNAITFGGYPVDLNVISDTLHLFRTTGINKYSQNEIKIYPNPADDRIVFSFDSDNIEELTIQDEFGRKILFVTNPDMNYILNVKDYSEGIYYITTLYSNRISRSKFLVIH